MMQDLLDKIEQHLCQEKIQYQDSDINLNGITNYTSYIIPNNISTQFIFSWTEGNLDTGKRSGSEYGYETYMQ